MTDSMDVKRAAARIAEYVRLTPVERSLAFGQISNGEVWFKLEHLQHTGSFKLRGAMNRILSLTREELDRGVITASNGNHGIAVCYAGAAVGIRPQVYLRHGVPELRVNLIEALGGEPIFYGENPLDAEVHARRLAIQTGRTFISPYNDEAVIAGQGTIGVELDHQLDAIDAVFIAVGGGGLISGVAAYLKAARPDVRIVGCWPENSPVMLECLKAGRIVDVPERPTLSDSTAGGIEQNSLTFPLCRDLIDEAVLVSEDEIRQAMRLVADHERWMIEGAAAVAVASFLKTKEAYRGRRVVILLCGRNIAAEKFLQACLNAAN